MNSKRLVAIYARGNNCDEKVESIVAKYKDNKDIEIVGIYTDEGKSGSTIESRTGFLNMMNDCRAHKFIEIHTCNIEQLTRNISDAQIILQELKTHGISVVYEFGKINPVNDTVTEFEKLIAK